MKKTVSVITAFVILLTSFIFPASAASAFSDVGSDRWSASSISYSVNCGYMKGVGDGKFDPAGSLTRAMVATVLWRRENSPAPSAPSGFDDVPAGEWYADAVAWAKEAGVVQGVSDKEFNPNGLITREQLATMLFRFSSSAPVSVPERADLSPFADSGKVSDWATEPLEWAVEAGLIKGTDGNRLSPGGFATREQFAAIIERYDKSFKLSYNRPVLFSHYTEKEYPLVDDADFYVAVDGNDSADGSLNSPFASWERARDAVRELRTTKTEGDIKVAFKAGVYRPLSVELTAEDSGTPGQNIVFCKYGDGDVIFTNGMDFDAESFAPISAEEESLFSDTAKDKIKKADISALYDLGLTDDDILVFYEGGLSTKARYPNKYEDGSDNLPESAVTHDDTSLEITSYLLQKRLAKYDAKQFDTMEIWGHIDRGYRKDTFKVAGYNADTHILEIANWQDSEFGRMRPGWAGADGKGIDMCLSNIPYELDYSHEYWIDHGTKTLYIFDPEETYFVPGPETMVTMENVDYVTFRGLSFMNTTNRFISAEACRNVLLELCKFSGTAAIEGVYFSNDTSGNTMNLTVRECTFANSYGHALYVAGRNTGVDKFEKDTHIVFDNNLVRTPNILYDVYNGVHFDGCTDVSVTHNRFEDCPRGAVSFTKTTNLTVEYNDFDSAMQNSNDGGVIYTDWICDARDLTVRFNYFGEVPEAGTGQFGLYLDEFTSGFDIYSNLFYNVSCTAMFSLGRDNIFRDNAVIKGACGWGTSTREEIEEAGSAEAAEKGGSWGIRYGKRIWGDLIEKLKDPAYRAVVEAKWPEMLKIHLDYDNLDDPYLANNPVTYIKNNRYINVKGIEPVTERKYELIYTTYEDEAAYTYAENPIFVNPTLGDYRIKDGVDFPDIRFEDIGRY